MSIATAPRSAPQDTVTAGATDRRLFGAMAGGGPGGDRCRELLVERYSWLATSAARRYGGRGETDDDLRQVAFVGLLEAIDRFDAERGVDFPFFARPTVYGEIRRHFRDGRRWVRVPRRLQELAAEARAATESLADRDRHMPTTRAIAEHLGAPESEVAEALIADQFFAPMSLDAPLSAADPDVATRADLIGREDDDIDTMLDATALRPLLATLPEREREIVMMTFYGNLTQAAIGQRLGISQMHVSRLLHRTLDGLRKRLDSD